MPSIPYPPWEYSYEIHTPGGATRYTTSTNYITEGPMGPQGAPADETKIKELQEKIVELEKKLNDFIDNPEKVRGIRKIDPYGEENWYEES